MEVLRQSLQGWTPDLEITDEIRQAASNVKLEDPMTPLEAAVVYSSRQDFEKLRGLLSKENVEPQVALLSLRHLDTAPESIDLHSYYVYEKKLGDMPEFPKEIMDDLLFPQIHNQISSAGNKRLGLSNSATKKDNPSVKSWLLELGVRLDAIRWWSRLVPGILNLLDSPEIADRARGCDLVVLLPHSRLERSGLIPVFKEAITPCIHFLPPSSEASVTMKIHHRALKALEYLSKSPTELNELMREGYIRPFGFTQGNFEFTLYLVKITTEFLPRLNGLVPIHLDEIIRIWMAIMADPFASTLPELLQSSEKFMCEVIKVAWPRVDQYKYDILFGLVKGGIMRGSPVLEVLRDVCQIDQGEIDELVRRSDKIASESRI